jgi:predicted nucleic acid-binding protein
VTGSGKMPSDNFFVLDTSAILALRGDEPGAGRVENLLLQARARRCRLLVSFITRMELLYTIWRREGEESGRASLRLVDSFNLEWVTCEPEILQIASELKATGSLSLADSWIAATAVVRDAILIHKDPEFAKLKAVSQEFLKT